MPTKSSFPEETRGLRVKLPLPCKFESQISRLIAEGLQIHASPATTFSTCTDWPVRPTGRGDEMLIRIDTISHDASWRSIAEALYFSPLNGFRTSEVMTVYKPLGFLAADYNGIFPGTRRRYYLHCVNVGMGTDVEIDRQVSALIIQLTNPENLYHLVNSKR